MNKQEIQWLLQEKYHGEKSDAFFADCKRLMLGEPLAYLIGWTPFLNCKIWLDSHPLIPRPETEYWAQEAINTIKGRNPTLVKEMSVPPQVLDLCAGSGCIGIAVAKDIPEACVDFSEIDAAHLPTIAKNLSENNIDKSRYHLFHSNLFENSTQSQNTTEKTITTKRYDFILSNPPYIDKSLNRTESSVIKHEPYVALFGGEGGLEVIQDIITHAPQHLTPGGQLWIEHEPEQSAAIKQLGETAHFSVTTYTDQYNTERYSVLMLQWNHD